MANVISRTALSSTTTITGSTAETLMHSYVIPANLFASAGRAARTDLAGTVTPNTTAPTATLRARIRPSSSTGLGTLVWATSAIALSSGSTTQPFRVLSNVIATSSAVQTHWASVAVGSPGEFTPADSFTGLGASTLDSNVALVYQLTAQLNSTSTGLALSAQVATVELVR